MRIVLWLPIGSLFLACGLFSEEALENEMVLFPSSSQQEEIAANTPQKWNDSSKELPAFAAPRNVPKKIEHQSKDSISRPTSFEGDLHHTQTLAERMSVVENCMAAHDKFSVSENPVNGLVTIDFLYWKAKTDESFYGLVSDPPAAIFAGQQMAGSDHGKIARLDFSWAPGGRLGIEQMITRTWSSALYWTCYRNQTHSEIKTDKVLDPIYFGDSSDGAQAKWKLFYNTMDLEFAAAFRLAKNVVFKPYMGLRGAWIRHTFRGIYDYRKLYGAPTAVSIIYFWAPASAEEVHREHFWGVGPRVGSFVFYKFGKSGFNLFANGSGSLLVGRVKTILKKEVGNGFDTQDLLRDDFSDMKVNFQALLGAEYHYVFDKATKALSLHASWEANYWWDMNDFSEIFGTSPNTPLSRGTKIFATGVNGSSQPNQAMILLGLTAGITFEY